ncbi:hypothetical protein OBCHQ24_18720 [Oceanobacillus iheyensis]|nr:hypothetical protein OBCHQ24_18720 [Oceanobacillus iheyensis]
MKRTNKKSNIAFWGCRISLSLSLVILFLLLFLRIIGVYVQFGTPPPWIGHHLIGFLLIVNVVITMFFMVKDSLVRTIVVVAGIFFILTSFFPVRMELLPTEYTTFNSPIDTSKYLAAESGSGKLYKLSESGLYMTLVTTFSTDGMFHPLAEGAYKIEKTSSKEFILHYAFNRENPDGMYREITVQVE